MTDKARIALIVAVAENGVIGRNGQLPWRLSSDLKHFRGLTLGKPVVMGRKTFELIGKPLDGRDTIVVTRQADFGPSEIYRACSMEEALALCQELAAARGANEVMIIGGAEIYRLALVRAQRVYLTLVHAAPEGDARFDALDGRQWRETDRQPMPQGPNDQFPAEFIVLDRQG